MPGRLLCQYLPGCSHCQIRTRAPEAAILLVASKLRKLCPLWHPTPPSSPPSQRQCRMVNMCSMLGKQPHTTNWRPMPISPLRTSPFETRAPNLPSFEVRPSSELRQLLEAKMLSQLSSLDLPSSGRITATREHVAGGGVEAGRSGLPLPQPQAVASTRSGHLAASRSSRVFPSP